MTNTKLFPDTRLYSAAEIYSSPETKARPAIKPKSNDPDDKGQPARRAHPARRGILKIGKTQFYRNLEVGRFPEADATVSGKPAWSGRLLNDHLYKRQ